MIKPDEKLYQWLKDYDVIKPLEKAKIREVGNRWLKDYNVIKPLEKAKIREVDNQKIISLGLSECGYDLSLGGNITTPKRPKFHKLRNFVHSLGFDDLALVLDPHNPVEWERVNLKRDKLGRFYYDIPPNRFVISVSEQYIRMPKDWVAICFGKSTYARNGIVVPMTPLEPGWYGYVTLEIGNLTDCYNRIYPYEGICQVVFLPLESKVAQSYIGAYQGQEERPYQATVY